MKMVKREQPKPNNGVQPRASITFPPDIYNTIEDLAKPKKVSIAWIVREAVEKYVTDQWPLLGPLKGE